jgi:5'-nucleotidase
MGKLDGLVIGFDADEVMFHWNETFAADLVADHPHLEFPFLKNNVNWDMTTGLTPEGQKAIQTTKDKPGFYRRLRPIDGAKEAMEEMMAEGAHVVVATAPTLSNPTCASDKHASIIEHYGTDVAKRTIITDDKTLLDLDFLIDDKPHITGFNTREGRRPIWDHIIFDQTYNRHVDTPLRLKGWENWREVVYRGIELKYERIA